MTTTCFESWCFARHFHGRSRKRPIRWTRPLPAAPQSPQPLPAPIAPRPTSSATPSPSRAEVLAFLGVAPGMRVVDMFSAGGYYTELLARTVGVKGQVIAYNNPPYAKFAEKGIAERYADGRLGNVQQVTAEVGDLQLAPASIDAALFVMSYHDAYWRPEDGSWNETDPAMLLERLFAGAQAGRRGRRAGPRRECRAATPPKWWTRCTGSIRRW